MTTPAATGERVVVGMDPHKRSVTIEVMTGDEAVLGGGRFTTDAAGFTALLAQTDSGLLDLHGIGPTGAARLLVEVGPVSVPV